MNVYKFVKENGLEKAKAVVEGVPDTATHFNHNSLGGHYAKEVVRKKQPQWAWFNTIDRTWYYDFADNNHFAIYELKQAIADYELVSIHGFKRSKQILEDAPPDAECYSWLLGNSGVYDRTVVLADLKAAIQRIEQGESA